MGFSGFADVKSAKVEAKIIRADGTVVDLGEISYWHKNPFKRWAWALKRALKDNIGGGVS